MSAETNVETTKAIFMINILGAFSTGLSADKSPPEKILSMMTEIASLQEIIAKFKAMRVDPTEYACLKGIVMFKTGSFELCAYNRRH